VTARRDGSDLGRGEGGEAGEERMMAQNYPAVKHQIEKDKLIITADISAAAVKRALPSSTGKSRIVCGTGGYLKLSNGLKVMVNVIAPVNE
jgi:hypothetical protein